VALQSSVEVTVTLAEVILAGIPQGGENRNFQPAHIDIFTMRDRFAEPRGVIGEFAVAVGLVMIKTRIPATAHRRRNVPCLSRAR
jgi:hypothetical protein